MDCSCHQAASLLVQVKKIALNELSGKANHQADQFSEASAWSSGVAGEMSSSDDNSFNESDFGRLSGSPLATRCRSVSVSSSDLEKPHQISPVSSQVSLVGLVPLSPAYSPDSTTNSAATQDSPVPTLALTCPFKLPACFVGCHVRGGEVKGVLRKKFSWKSFPLLEAYLIEHRPEYLQYSSQLNYTADQKRYNNRLTQGLLDLAAEEGYVFEGFTFAALRDRIRCYYKSYVQAVKKKKHKRK